MIATLVQTGLYRRPSRAAQTQPSSASILAELHHAISRAREGGRCAARRRRGHAVDAGRPAHAGRAAAGRPVLSPFSNIPTALGNVGGLPASPLVLGPPIPIKKVDTYAYERPAGNDDNITGPHHTLDPNTLHKFRAPAMDFVTTEAHSLSSAPAACSARMVAAPGHNDPGDACSARMVAAPGHNDPGDQNPTQNPARSEPSQKLQHARGHDV